MLTYKTFTALALLTVSVTAMAQSFEKSPDPAEPAEEIALCLDSATKKQFHVTHSKEDAGTLYSHSTDHSKVIKYTLGEYAVTDGKKGVYDFKAEKHFKPEVMYIRVTGTGDDQLIKNYTEDGKFVFQQRATCTIGGSADQARKRLIAFAEKYATKKDVSELALTKLIARSAKVKNKG